MKLKAFGDENMAHLSAYYYSEESGEEKKLEMEEYLKNIDSKKFKEFMEWKEEIECKFPFVRDVLLGRQAPPLHWEVKEDQEETSFVKKIYIKIKEELEFRFQRYYFT